MATGLAAGAAIRHLILDRDGVLNEEAPAHGYILRAEEFRWLPGSLEALVVLSQAGLRLSVATNQSAVGRGLMSPSQLELILARMRSDAEAAGARLSGIYFCPHAPGAGCDCRKPAPGLLLSAVRDSGIREHETLMVGDDVRDVTAARAAGITPVLVRTGKGLRAAATLAAEGAPLGVFDDLAHLAHTLVNRPLDSPHLQQA